MLISVEGLLCFCLIHTYAAKLTQGWLKLIKCLCTFLFCANDLRITQPVEMQFLVKLCLFCRELCFLYIFQWYSKCQKAFWVCAIIRNYEIVTASESVVLFWGVRNLIIVKGIIYVHQTLKKLNLKCGFEIKLVQMVSKYVHAIERWIVQYYLFNNVCIYSYVGNVSSFWNFGEVYRGGFCSKLQTWWLQ